ncbi:MAG: hypothetical protein JOZ57_17155, partial [Abitibacteriaceae bacterium]|nr:hypothetical protein [Abditibacteriaceae bacterium]
MPGQSAESPLSQMQIAAPCQSSWDKMPGGDQVRFCQSCYKNVYNLSHMTRTEAVQLVTQTEGHSCARYYRRADGTIMTEECPVGLHRVHRPLKCFRAAMLGFFAPLLGFVAVVLGTKLTGATTNPQVGATGPIARLRSRQPFQTIGAWIDPTPINDAVIACGVPSTRIGSPYGVPAERWGQLSSTNPEMVSRSLPDGTTKPAPSGATSHAILHENMLQL